MIAGLLGKHEWKSQRRNSNILSSFRNDSIDAGPIKSKGSCKRRSVVEPVEFQYESHERNKDVSSRLPKFKEKNNLFKVHNESMHRANLTLEALPRPNQPLKSDSNLDDYRVIKVLGKGTFAKVKLAEHIPTGHKVAIKVIDKSRIDEDDICKIQREIDIMKQLNHPNIIRLYQVIHGRKYINIIMEYASRGEIFDYIVAKKRLSEEDSRSKFRQLLSAIAYCHSKNIVHRDLKLENLLLDGEYNVKVCDFGFGNYYDNDKRLDTYCGSPPYAAPELFRGDEYIGPEVDIWSLGVILFTFFTGNLPFNGKTIGEIKANVMKGSIKVPNYVSVTSEMYLRKFLKFDPCDRITSQQALRESWINIGYVVGSNRNGLTLENPLNTTVVETMVTMGYLKERLLRSVESEMYDDAHATYRILCLHNDERKFFDSFKPMTEEKVLKSTNHEMTSILREATKLQNGTSNGYEGHHDKSALQSSNPKSNNNNHNNNYDIDSYNIINVLRRQGPNDDNPSSNLHQKLLRSYSIERDLIDGNAKPAVKSQLSRKLSLAEKMSPGEFLRKGTTEDIIKKNEKEHKIAESGLKRMSKNIFKKKKNREPTVKEKEGAFMRRPSMSLKNSSESSLENNTNSRKNCSSIVSYQLNIDSNSNGIASRKNSKVQRKTTKDAILFDPSNARPIFKQQQAPTFKEKFMELIRIKKH